MTPFQEVSHFNTSFSNPFGNATRERLIKQCNMLPEEYQELRTAVEAQDELQTRDALCDLLVLSFGALHLMGVNYDTLGGPAYPRRLYLRNEDVPADVTRALPYFETTAYPALQAALETAEDTDLIVRPLLDIIDYALGMYNLFGQDTLVEADMHAVYTSNMSKLNKDQEELDATVAKYEAMGMIVRSEGEFPTMAVKSDIDQNIPALNEDGTQALNGDGTPMMFHFPAGKILKGINYAEPVFA